LFYLRRRRGEFVGDFCNAVTEVVEFTEVDAPKILYRIFRDKGLRLAFVGEGKLVGDSCGERKRGWMSKEFLGAQVAIREQEVQALDKLRRNAGWDYFGVA
jgi:hypothetical protein